MRSVCTRRFWVLFHSLPIEVQEVAEKNYRLWRLNPGHPSLHFHRLGGSPNRFTIRVGHSYRALGSLAGETITWVWIGTHADYNGLVKTK